MEECPEIVLKRICCTCLSKNRKLFQLCRIVDGINNLYLLLSSDAEAYREGFFKDTASLFICWECEAIMRKISSFRRNACISQKHLTDIANGRAQLKLDNTSLSCLSTHHITNYESVISETNDKSHNSENFIDCGPAVVKTESDIDDVPLSELKNYYDDSSCKFEKDDMEYLEPIYVKTLDEKIIVPVEPMAASLNFTAFNDGLYLPSGSTSKCDDSIEDATYVQTPINSSTDTSDNEGGNDNLNGATSPLQPRRYGLEEFQNLTKCSEMEETNDVESNGTKKKPKRKRNRDFCFFCETYVLSFGRHIILKHDNESDVQEILSYPAGSFIRKNLIAVLRIKGNNVAKVAECVQPMRDSDNCPCIENLVSEKKYPGSYTRKNLWKHTNTCRRSDGRDFILRLREDVFPVMKPDRITSEAKKDKLIRAYGAQCLRDARQKNLISFTSTKMRELAKLLIELKRMKTSIKNLTDCLKPQNYELIVNATKKLSNYDENAYRYSAPIYTHNISRSLKKCCEIALKRTDKSPANIKTTADDIRALIRLIQKQWKLNFSSRTKQ